MKKLLYIFVPALFAIGMFSCKEVADTSGKTTILHDSMVNVLPTWQSLKIKVNDEQDEMLIVVGDATLYKASQEEKLRKTEDVGKLVIRIYGKDNRLKKGEFIITNDVRNESWTPADGIRTPIDFEALKRN
jgi:hypothetical protein